MTIGCTGVGHDNWVHRGRALQLGAQGSGITAGCTGVGHYSWVPVAHNNWVSQGSSVSCLGFRGLGSRAQDLGWSAGRT